MDRSPRTGAAPHDLSPPPTEPHALAWHAEVVETVEMALGTSGTGLSEQAAADRLPHHGPNLLPEAPPERAWVLFLRQFANPLILILVVAAVITAVMGELLDTALIAIALLINAIIGFTQERRAAGAVQALMQLVVPHSRVIRDGHIREISSADLVPGDLVVLEPGTRVPADVRLATESSLAVDESTLTGESLPVGKSTAAAPVDTVVADRTSMAFAGTIVTSGRGRGYVVATGQHTELGAIAGLIGPEDPTTSPLHIAMASFARLIGISVMIAAVVTFVSGILLGGTAEEMFRTAVAMAVSAVPEGLPIAVTVTLAIGVSRMARRNAVLRRLPALETLGSTTVIGSDKTGTLTENRMTVQMVWAGGRSYAIEQIPRAAEDPLPAILDGAGSPAAVHLALAVGALTNEAGLEHADGRLVATGDPTEAALLLSADAAGLDPAGLRERHREVVTIPFEAEHRYSASVRDVGGRRVVLVKGAPERVVEMCTSELTDDGPVALHPDAAYAVANSLAGQGLRVLALALRVLPDGEDAAAAEPHDLMLVGFQSMMDPPRAGVRDAIAACRAAGVRVVMITGDHATTARAIADRLGIVDDDQSQVLTGAEMADLDEAALGRLVERVSVYARVAPDDKLRIVRALQGQGHVVAVTGDGVNDAPALRAAEIGVSMGVGGTDVAREASDMVLSDDNFVSIVGAVEEGRISFSNIRKVTFFLISTALAETVAIMVSVWLGWPLLLLPAQILWLNLVTNGVQDLALAFEPGSPHVLRRAPRDRREGVLSPMMWERTMLVGLVMAAGALYMFWWALDGGATLVAAHSVTLTTLVVFNVFQAGNARSESTSLFRLKPWGNRFLLLASLAAIGLYVGALYLPATQFVLGVEPIGLEAWLRAILVASSVLVAVEIHKAIRRRWPSGRRRTHG